MTFSIVARDPATGDLGVAVQSKFPFVGPLVTYAVAGVGAVATQAWVEPAYGPRGLELLRQGSGPDAAIRRMLADDELAERRQLALLDSSGRVAVHTGSDCTAWAGHAIRPGLGCQGNILAGPGVVGAMVEVMEGRLDLRLPERLVTALAAAQAAGGDRRGQQSAALIVVRPGGGFAGAGDRLVDLRVDDARLPIDELDRLLALHRLHFDQPADEDLVPLEGELAAEVARLLGRLGAGPRDASPEALDAAYEAWAGHENYEARLVRRGTIDRLVLGILRDAAGGAGGRSDPSGGVG